MQLKPTRSCFSMRRIKTNFSIISTHHLLIVSLLEVIISMVNKTQAAHKTQSIQPKIVNPRSSHTTSASMLGIMSSTLTRLRNHGKHPLHKECHCLIPMLSGLRVQFIHLRTANLKSFHTTREITHSVMSSTITHRRNLGRLTPQMVCHWLALLQYKDQE